MPVVGMTYNWSVPSGATILNGQGTNNIQVQFGAGFTNGNVSVNAQNACGTSTARVKSVKAAPAIPASITGPASVCQGQQGVNYTAATVWRYFLYLDSSNQCNHRCRTRNTECQRELCYECCKQ